MQIHTIKEYKVLVDDNLRLPLGRKLLIGLRSKRGKPQPPRVLFYNESGKRISLSRFVLGVPNSELPLTADSLIVDHINGNTLDNRRENLRVCKMWENSMNRERTRGGEYPGVIHHPNGRWRGQLQVNKKQYYTKYSLDKNVVIEEMKALRAKLGREVREDFIRG